MDWRVHIESNPGVLKGRPVVRGTRITVEFLINLFAGGWSEQRILDEFPHLTADGVRASLAFAHDMLRDEEFVAVSKVTAG